MAVLGGGKKKTRNKNKTETVTVNADGSKTVTVTKNKTTTKTKGPRRTPRPKVTAVSTLKPDPIKRVQPKQVTINATPIKERPQKIKDIQANINLRSLMERANARESQPLAPSPRIPNRRSYRSRG
tara:strand:- start:1272 stop:1649 length:378 start_codon:yes stop_codon:yes gene_type:complete